MKNFTFAKDYNPTKREIEIEERNHLTFNMRNSVYDSLEPIIIFIHFDYETLVSYHGLMSINDIVESIETNITSKTKRIDVDIYYNNYKGDKVDTERLFEVLIERFGELNESNNN